MDDCKFFLTFDLKLIFCSDRKYGLRTSQFNIDTKNFEPIDLNLNELNFVCPVENAESEQLIKEVYLSKMSYLLTTKDMNWIKQFESLFNKDSAIIEKDNLVFNLLILKLKLIGFSENLALKFTKYYFKFRKDNEVYPVKNLLLVLDNFIANKQFWITSDIQDHYKIETDFIKKILKDKAKNAYMFDFKKYKTEYFELCRNSYTRANYLLNTNPEFIFYKKLPTKDLNNYLIKSYKWILLSILTNLMNTKYEIVLKDDYFFNQLVSDMVDVLKIAIKTF